MVDSAINLIIKRWKNNLILAVVMGLTILLGVLSVSTYEKLTEKTKFYEEFLKLHGGMYYFEYFKADAKECIATTNAKPDEVHGILEYCFAVDDTSLNIYAYDKLASNYKIPLKAGKWYSDANDNQYVNAVITPNTLFGIGDLIHPADYMEDANPNLVLRVCGITEDKFDYFFPNMFSLEGMSVQKMYDNYYSGGMYSPVLIFIDAGKVEDLPEFRYTPNILLGFNDEKTEKEFDDSPYDFAKNVTLEELRTNTNHEVEKKLYEVLPVFIAAFLLTLMCIICIVSIETSYDMGTYAIFFISGMKWKDIVGLNAVKACVDFLVGLIIMAILGLVGKSLILQKDLIISIGNSQIVLCIILYVLFLSAFCIAPLVIINRKMPVDVIRKTNV